MISIDQLLHFIGVNQIGRKRKRHNRDKHLFNAVYLSERMIRMAFYLSKMTVADEKKDGPLEFTHLKFVEFLEFIGRLSFYFFEATPQHFEWSLTMKCKVMLQWFFTPTSLPFVDPEDREGNLSDSEADYE